MIVVEVDEGGLEAGTAHDAARWSRVAKQHGDVGEGAVAAVAEQRQGVGELAEVALAPGEHPGVGVVEVAHEDQVEEAVGVVVAPGAAHGAQVAAGLDQSGGRGHLLEGAVAAVAEQLAGAVVAHVEIGIAVVVVVGGAGAVGPARGILHPGLGGDVDEAQAAEVPVQRVGADHAGDVEVQQPVAVEVRHRHSAAERHQVVAAPVGERHPRRLGHLGERRRDVGEPPTQCGGTPIRPDDRHVHLAGGMRRQRGAQPARRQVHHLQRRRVAECDGGSGVQIVPDDPHLGAAGERSGSGHDLQLGWRRYGVGDGREGGREQDRKQRPQEPPGDTGARHCRLGRYWWRSVGSRLSRRPSPNRISDSTTMNIAVPGNVDRYQLLIR